MRKIYRYNISSNEKLVNTLLFLSKKKTHVSNMISNRNKSDSILPEYYMQYDLIVGVEKKHDIKVDMNSLLELKKFHNRHNDWMFGYISYDLKNEIEGLNSLNNDRILSNNLSFFIPLYF